MSNKTGGGVNELDCLEAKTKEAGLTNEEVAKKLSINQATYYRKKEDLAIFIGKRLELSLIY